MFRGHLFIPFLRGIAYHVVMPQRRRIGMQDFAFLAVTVLFFAVSIGYTFGCDRL